MRPHLALPSFLWLGGSAVALAACSAPDVAPTEASTTDDVTAAFTCELTSGADAASPSGDGSPERLQLRRRAKDRHVVDVNLLGAWDLAHPPSRGLPRECELLAQDGAEDVFVCRAEPEWNHFETTSTLRVAKGALDRVAPFDLVYHAAKDDGRTTTGFREWSTSKRVFACKR